VTHLGGQELKPKITFVTPVAPALDGPDSFAIRAYHLLDALAEVGRIDVVLWGRAQLEPANATRGWQNRPGISLIRTTTRGSHRMHEQSAIGRVRRALHYTLARRPAGNYPRSDPALDAHLELDAPQLVCLYLPETAHLAFRVPRHIPIVSLVEEGLERRALAHAASDSLRYRFAARTEATRARRLYRRLSRRARVIVAISDEEADWFRLAGVRAQSLVVLPHGVDTGYFSALRDDGVLDIDVALFGNLRERRNLTPALAVLEESRTRAMSWKWAFVGDIDREVRDCLSDRGVIAPGYVSDIRPYYERTRVVLVPAGAETGVKTSLLQAWAMRRPVVASAEAVRGVKAVPGENVLVGATMSELIEQCTSVLASAELREQLAVSGHHTVAANHDVNAISRDFARLCLSIVAGAGAS
jgi:glycosyltransferase involved in cell wall biosynthesis